MPATEPLAVFGVGITVALQRGLVLSPGDLGVDGLGSRLGVTSALREMAYGTAHPLVGDLHKFPSPFPVEDPIDFDCFGHVVSFAFLVEPIGIEPMTFCLQSKRSPG